MGLKKYLLIKWCIIAVVLFALVYLTYICYVINHETIHGAIFRDYGSPYNITINYVAITGYTQGDRTICNGACQALQNEETIQGYNSAIIIFSLWMVFFAYLFVAHFIPDAEKIINETRTTTPPKPSR